MKVFKFPLLSFAIVLAVFFTSCKSDETTDADALTSTTQYEVKTAGMSDEIVIETDDYINDAQRTGFSAAPSINRKDTFPVVTVDKPDTLNFPKTITIDFGTTGVVTKRGNSLKGKIIVVLTGKMNVIGSTRSISFNSFSINNNVVDGTKTVIFSGYTDDMHPYWTINSNLVVTFADGQVFTWNSQRIRERISDNNTPLRSWDDKYAITGSAYGVDKDGDAYSILIDGNNPLILDGGYPFFVKGTMTVTIGKRNMIIDYGDGTKDNKATVTVGGVTKEITMGR